MSLPLLTRLPQYQVTVHLPEIADPNIAEVTRLASILPTSSTPSSLSPPSRDLHVTGLRYHPSIVVPSHVHTLVSPAAILSQDSTSRWYSSISDLVGSPSDLRISLVTLGPSTFGLGHQIRSLRIYFGSSLDLSDSSLILEIGLSLEILCISRPFAHLGPLPFPLPLTLRLPLTGRRRDSFWLGRLLTRAPYLRWSSYSSFRLRPFLSTLCG